MKLLPSQYRFPCAVLLLAVLFAVATMVPHILQHIDRTYPFQGLAITPSDAELHYVARVREITDGFTEAGNVFYSAPKHQPFLLPPFPEMIPAFAAQMFHVDPVTMFVVWACISAFALVIVVMGFLIAVTGAGWEALMAVTALLFAGTLLGGPIDVLWHFPGFSAFGPLRFSRPINPLWTTTVFFAACWFLAGWTHRQSWKTLAGLGLCMIALVYSYVYAWTYLGASLALITLWYVAARQWNRVRDLVVCGLAISALAAPYVIHLSVLAHDPSFADSAARLGLVPTHAPLLGFWTAVFAAVTVLSRWRWRTQWHVVLCLFLGGVLVMNQQIVTGSAVVPQHYHWYFFHPLATLLTVTMILQALGGLLPSIPKIQTLVASILLAVAVGFGFAQEYAAYQTARPVWGTYQTMAPVLRFIGSHMHAGDVVYSTDHDILDFVPAYTSADVYLSTQANNYLVPLSRARAVFFFDLWVRGVTAEDARRRFPTDLRYRLSSALYSIYYRELLGDYARIPDALVRENIALYRRYLASSAEEKLTRYPIHAVVLRSDDPATPALWEITSRSIAVFSSAGYSVRLMKSLDAPLQLQKVLVSPLQAAWL